MMGLFYSQLDRDLIVWGVAYNNGAVTASRSQEDADIDSGRGGNVVAYYHPEKGWTNAATGHPIDSQ